MAMGKQQCLNHRNHVHVAEELVYEILSRLPVKSLLRFKIACKTWYNLIRSSQFIKDHHRHLTTNPDRLLVYIPTRNYHDFAMYPDETLSGHPPLHDHLKLPRDPNYPLAFDFPAFAFGPVNGFVLLHDYDWTAEFPRFLFFNPSTRESKMVILPDSYMKPPGFKVLKRAFGFGFVNNSFKIISLMHLGVAAGNPYRKSAAIYSSDTDSWKHFCPCLPSRFDPDQLVHSLATRHANYKLVDSFATTHANYGSCYWLFGGLEDKHGTNPYALLSFDMESERFREIKIEGPQIQNPPIGKRASLLLHNGYIAMLVFPNSFYPANKSTELWVMKEDGCWTNLREHWQLPARCYVLGTWNNNQLLISTYDGLTFNDVDSREEVILYDVDSGEFRGLGIKSQTDRRFMYFIQVFKYRESLASLKSVRAGSITVNCCLSFKLSELVSSIWCSMTSL